MLIDLSDIILQERKDAEFNIDIEMDKFRTKTDQYTFAEKKQVKFIFSSVGKNVLVFDASISISLTMPCDRCLEDVRTKILVETSKEIDLNNTEEQEYIEDKNFDVEKFVYNEILIELPMKVLCSIDCKGVCNRCGTNLNRTTCDCDTTELDPRMSKVLDLFKEYKEV